MVAQDGTVNPAIGGWNEALEELHRRIAGRFARSEARGRAKRYLLGLLGRVERKNGWQLAEAIGDNDPQGVQRLLNSAKWDADAVRDDLRGYVVEHLGDEESGVLLADETGSLRKGEKAVRGRRPSVHRHRGRHGRLPGQVGVFLVYSHPRRERRSWTGPSTRRACPEGPDERSRSQSGGRRPRGAPLPRNEIELAEEILQRAFACLRVPARWVLARSWLRSRRNVWGVGCWSAGAPTTIPKTRASSSHTAPKVRPPRNSLRYARSAGRWRSASPRPRAR